MRTDLFHPTDESEARILLLIEAFSRGSRSLEGRTKLAKLDFFLRYPTYLRRALEVRAIKEDVLDEAESRPDLETRMVRYRYGPWDPSYYATLGNLIGKGLVVPVPVTRGIGYKATKEGREVARRIREESVWEDIGNKLELLRKHLNLQGTTLKKLIYDNFPEISKASWGERL